MQSFFFINLNEINLNKIRQLQVNFQLENTIKISSLFVLFLMLIACSISTKKASQRILEIMKIIIIFYRLYHKNEKFERKINIFWPTRKRIVEMKPFRWANILLRIL